MKDMFGCILRQTVISQEGRMKGALTRSCAPVAGLSFVSCEDHMDHLCG